MCRRSAKKEHKKEKRRAGKQIKAKAPKVRQGACKGRDPRREGKKTQKPGESGIKKREKRALEEGKLRYSAKKRKRRKPTEVQEKMTFLVLVKKGDMQLGSRRAAKRERQKMEKGEKNGARAGENRNWGTQGG